MQQWSGTPRSCMAVPGPIHTCSPIYYSRLLRDDVPAWRGRPPPGEPAADAARSTPARGLRVPVRSRPRLATAAAAHEDHPRDGGGARRRQGRRVQAVQAVLPHGVPRAQEVRRGGNVEGGISK